MHIEQKQNNTVDDVFISQRSWHCHDIILLTLTIPNKTFYCVYSLFVSCMCLLTEHAVNFQVRSPSIYLPRLHQESVVPAMVKLYRKQLILVSQYFVVPEEPIGLSSYFIVTLLCLNLHL